MAAAAQDGALVYPLGRGIADGGRRPEWRAGTEYGAVRAKIRAARR